eukprot:SM000071S21100  [mRNA]  locus=s71:416935:419966:+ [translate_table: standard]
MAAAVGLLLLLLLRPAALLLLPQATARGTSSQQLPSPSSAPQADAAPARLWRLNATSGCPVVAAPRRQGLGDASAPWRVAACSRWLEGRGAHRALRTQVQLELKPERPPAEGGMTGPGPPPTASCTPALALVERLPSGVFVDPFELQRLHRAKQCSQAMVCGTVDLERPSPLCEPSGAMVFADEATTADEPGKPHELLRHFSARLPVHARYPEVDMGPCRKHATVLLLPPLLLITCYDTSLNKSEQEASIAEAIWTELDMDLLSEAKDEQVVPLEWLVPVGCSEHAWLVTWVTGITAVGGAACLIHVILFKGESEHQELISVVMQHTSPKKHIVMGQSRCVTSSLDLQATACLVERASWRSLRCFRARALPREL